MLLASGGCYTFRQVPIETPSPGSTVRAEVDQVGARTVAEFTGAASSSVQGSLVRRDSAAVILAVARNDLSLGEAFQPGRLEVPLPRQHIMGFSLRALSPVRTGVLMAGIAAALVVVTRALWHGAGGGLPPNGPPSGI